MSKIINIPGNKKQGIKPQKARVIRSKKYNDGHIVETLRTQDGKTAIYIRRSS